MYSGRHNGFFLRHKSSGAVWRKDLGDGAGGKIVVLSRFVALSVSLTQTASLFQGGVQSVSGSPLLAPDNDTLLFYLGGQQGFSVSCVGPGSQTGLATLRRDGYAAMDTNSSHAGVLTSE